MRAALLWLILVAVLLSLSLVIVPDPVLAQETTGQVEGRVLDAAGKPIAAADVVVSSPSLQGTRGSSTDARGYFRVLVLPVGEYMARVTRTGYAGRVFEGVDVSLGQTTSLGEIKLEERAYEQPEVVVRERAPLVDPTSTETGGTLEAKDYDALPVDRSYRNVISLLPQANQSFLGDPVNLAGATGFENRYFVDGIDVTDSYRSWGGADLPYNIVQEVQVKTGGYQAEYRSSLGGTIDAVTYSGGNEVHGQLFGFFTNNTFTGTPRSLPGSEQEGDYSIYDAGFSVGGPILRDKLWYYAAYNPSFRQEDVRVVDWGTYEDWTRTHSFAGKLTWRANNRNTFTFTAIGDPSRSRSVGMPPVVPEAIDPFLNRINSGGVNFMVDGRHLLRNNLLLETSLSRSVREDDYYPETERGRSVPLFTDSTQAQSGGGNTIEYVTSTVTMPRAKLTWSKDNHEVKAGLEYKEVALDFDITMWGIWEHTAEEALEAGSAYYSLIAKFKGHVGTRIPSAFVQDSWRLTDRLRLNLGVRWDGQYIISSEGTVAQTILDQWQPRVGFVYEPGRAGSQKVSGAFGRYYQELATSGAFWYYNSGRTWTEIAYDHNPLIDPSGGDTLYSMKSIVQEEMDDLQGQYLDEFTLGYDWQAGDNVRVGIHGVYRTLRQGLEDCLVVGTGEYIIGNPGSGLLTDYPRMKRDYGALELTCRQSVGDRLSYMASYVLSKTEGNYEGLFDSQYYNMWVNATGLFDAPEALINAEGLLPNDRTHVFKLSGSYRVAPGLTLGAFGYWESGTPLSEWGTDPIRDPDFRVIYLRERGTAGRTPSIWDLNVRVGYQPRFAFARRWQPKVTVDFLHVASQRQPVAYDQRHYFGVDAEGNQIDPNPNYGKPIAWQPPMAVRLGLEVNF